MASDKEFIKTYRKLLENPIIWKDNDHVAMWLYLLLTVEWKEKDMMFGKDRITLKPGQGIYGRKMLADKLHISESKCERILNLFKIEQQIEQQTSSKNRLITILNWSSYQKSEQQFEQQVNNKWTTSEQQVDTYKEEEELKKFKNKDTYYATKAREDSDSRYVGISLDDAFEIIKKKPFTEPLTEEEIRIVRLHDKAKIPGGMQ